MEKRIIVAIDGPAGAGKSTIARAIAQRLGFLYIDTGAMYRAVALMAIREETPLSDTERLEEIASTLPFRLDADARVYLNDEDVSETIRAAEVSAAASRVSVVRGVREALVNLQRRIAADHSVVMEGRDIGTVVFPYATVKIFLDADTAVRSERRMREMESKRIPITSKDVTAEILERDARDRSRAESPLLQAPDAVYLDTSKLDQAEVEERILKLIRDRTANGKETSR